MTRTGLIIVVGLSVVTGACGGAKAVGSSSATASATAIPSVPTSTASPNPSASVTPGALDTLPSFQTSSQAEQYGRQKIEQVMRVTYVDGPKCPDTQSCLFDRHAFAGTAAAYSGYAIHWANDGGVAMFVYLVQDSRGWHFLNAQGTQNLGAPSVGVTDQVWLSNGCANVRDMPRLDGKTLACLPDATSVDIDGGPNFADGHLWWHLKGRGWMAHDFLVPKYNPGSVA